MSNWRDPKWYDTNPRDIKGRNKKDDTHIGHFSENINDNKLSDSLKINKEKKLFRLWKNFLLLGIPILLLVFLAYIIIDFSSNGLTPTYNEVVANLKELEKKVTELEKNISEEKIRYNKAVARSKQLEKKITELEKNISEEKIRHIKYDPANYQNYFIVRVELDNQRAVGEAELCANSNELANKELRFENQYGSENIIVKTSYFTKECEQLKIPLIKISEDDFNRIYRYGQSQSQSKEIITIVETIQ